MDFRSEDLIVLIFIILLVLCGIYLALQKQARHSRRCYVGGFILFRHKSKEAAGAATAATAATSAATPAATSAATPAATPAATSAVTSAAAPAATSTTTPAATPPETKGKKIEKIAVTGLKDTGEVVGAVLPLALMAA